MQFNTKLLAPLIQQEVERQLAARLDDDLDYSYFETFIDYDRLSKALDVRLSELVAKHLMKCKITFS